MNAFLRRQTCTCAALLLLLIASASAQEHYQGTILCYGNVPTEVPANFHAFKITRDFFAAGTNTSGYISIENTSLKTIMRIRLVIEYHSIDGNRLGEVTTQAEVRGADPLAVMKEMSRGSAPEIIKKPIAPGGAQRLGGLVWWTVATLPASARLTVAHLWFADGTQLRWMRPDAQEDPDPVEWRLSRLPACMQAAGIKKLYLALAIDSTGRVRNVQQGDAFRVSACDVRELQNWKFEPAERGGKPTDATLSILLRIFPHSELRNSEEIAVSPEDVQQPVIVVDAFAPERAQDAWEVLYGAGLPQGPLTSIR